MDVAFSLPKLLLTDTNLKKNNTSTYVITKATFAKILGRFHEKKKVYAGKAERI